MDARLIEASSLRANEVSLTGESLLVDKSVKRLPPDTPLAVRSNMVFLGTNSALGSGRALVIATGMRTGLGLIAQLRETAEKVTTPLQSRALCTALCGSACNDTEIIDQRIIGGPDRRDVADRRRQRRRSPKGYRRLCASACDTAIRFVTQTHDDRAQGGQRGEGFYKRSQLPMLQALFGTSPLTFQHFVIWIGLGFIPSTILEVRKVLLMQRKVLSQAMS